MSMALHGLSDRFCADYAAHRAREGRAHKGAELQSLPYLATGPLVRQWSVRARTFEALVAKVVWPLERDRPLDVLDLGAGNGWLSYRLALRGQGARSSVAGTQPDRGRDARPCLKGRGARCRCR